MKQRVLDYLACPECAGVLRPEVFQVHDGEIMEGSLGCAGCHRTYPVIAGVPRLLPDHLMTRVHSHYSSFFRKYPGHFDSSAKPRQAMTVEA